MKVSTGGNRCDDSGVRERFWRMIRLDSGTNGIVRIKETMQAYLHQNAHRKFTVGVFVNTAGFQEQTLL